MLKVCDRVVGGVAAVCPCGLPCCHTADGRLSSLPCVHHTSAKAAPVTEAGAKPAMVCAGVLR